MTILSQNSEIPDFYKNRTPESLLQDLKTLHRLNPELEGNIALEPSLGWVSASDAVALWAHVGDKSPCLRANNFLSSSSAIGPSTVESEAIRLILGYVRGAYPPADPNPVSLHEVKKLLLEKLQEHLDEHMPSDAGE